MNANATRNLDAVTTSSAPRVLKPSRFVLPVVTLTLVLAVAGPAHAQYNARPRLSPQQQYKLLQLQRLAVYLNQQAVAAKTAQARQLLARRLMALRVLQAAALQQKSAAGQAQPAWMSDLQRQMPELFQSGPGQTWLAQKRLQNPGQFQFGGFYGGNVFLDKMAGYMDHAAQSYNLTGTSNPFVSPLDPLLNTRR